VFSAVTKRLSVDSTTVTDFTTVASVIPTMDALHRHLTDFKKNDLMSKAVRRGCERGIAVLNKYYSKTDESELYRTALLLHPGYRVTCLRSQRWPADWINEAIALGRQLWETLYRDMYVDDEKREPEPKDVG
jgi:hypothetical protein